MNHMTVKDSEWDDHVTCEIDFPSIICSNCGYTSERLEDFGMYEVDGEEVILCHDCGELGGYDMIRELTQEDVEVEPEDYNFDDEEE